MKHVVQHSAQQWRHLVVNEKLNIDAQQLNHIYNFNVLQLRQLAAKHTIINLPQSSDTKTNPH